MPGYKRPWLTSAQDNLLQCSRLLHVTHSSSGGMGSALRSAGYSLLAEFQLDRPSSVCTAPSRLCLFNDVDDAAGAAGVINSSGARRCRAQPVWLLLLPDSNSCEAMLRQSPRGFIRLDYLLFSCDNQRAVLEASIDMPADVIRMRPISSVAAINQHCFLVRNASANLRSHRLRRTLTSATAAASFVWLRECDATAAGIRAERPPVATSSPQTSALLHKHFCLCAFDPGIASHQSASSTDAKLRSNRSNFELVSGTASACRWILGPFVSEAISAHDLEAMLAKCIANQKALIGEVLALPCYTAAVNADAFFGQPAWKLTVTPSRHRRSPADIDAASAALLRAAISSEWQQRSLVLAGAQPRLVVIRPGRRVDCSAPAAVVSAGLDWVPLSDAEAAAINCRFLFIGEIDLGAGTPVELLNNDGLLRLLPLSSNSLVGEFANPVDCRKALGAMRGAHRGRCRCVHLPDSLELTACHLSLPSHAFLPWTAPHQLCKSTPPLMRVPGSLASQLQFEADKIDDIWQSANLDGSDYDRHQFLLVSGLSQPAVPLRVLLAYLAGSFPAARSVHLFPAPGAASLTGGCSDRAVLRFDRPADCGDAARRLPPPGLTVRIVRLDRAWPLLSDSRHQRRQLPAHSLLTWLELCQPNFRLMALDIEPSAPPVDKRPFLCNCHNEIY